MKVGIDSPLLLTAQQAGELLGVNENTVRNLHRVGELRGVLCGRHLRWRPADVHHYVDRLGCGDGN